MLSVRLKCSQFRLHRNHGRWFPGRSGPFTSPRAQNAGDNCPVTSSLAPGNWSRDLVACSTVVGADDGAVVRSTHMQCEDDADYDDDQGAPVTPRVAY